MHATVFPVTEQQNNHAFLTHESHKLKRGYVWYLLILTSIERIKLYPSYNLPHIFPNVVNSCEKRDMQKENHPLWDVHNLGVI